MSKPKQLIVKNKLGQTFYLYKQSAMTKSHGKVTLHMFTQNPSFPKTAVPASKIPRDYFIHEDPFTNRITVQPESEREVKLKSVYEAT